MARNITIRGLGKVTKKLQRFADGVAVNDAFADVGQRARRWLADWYRRRGEDWFDTPGSPTHGAGRVDTNWAHDLMLVSSWNMARASKRSFATVAVRLAFRARAEKIAQFMLLADGGTISAKRARALTIPMVPEAHGISAGAYATRYGRRLFRPKGRSYLAENDFGRLRVVYLLRSSVRIKPMMKRNRHEPYAWRDGHFRPWVIRRMQIAMNEALK